MVVFVVIVIVIVIVIVAVIVVVIVVVIVILHKVPMIVICTECNPIMIVYSRLLSLYHR